MKSFILTVSVLLLTSLSAQAEPQRRVSYAQAEKLCNQSLLPGKEKYAYYCQFRKPPVASTASRVTVATNATTQPTPVQAQTPAPRNDIVTAYRDEDDSGAAFFRKYSKPIDLNTQVPNKPAKSNNLFGKSSNKPVMLAKEWEGYHAARNRRELSKFLEIDPLSVAWCAAFVNTILKQSGFEGTNSLMARSFLQYGSITRVPEYGDIVVFKRGRNEAAGHVGFYVGEEVVEGVRYILVLGGNQRKEVNIAYYPANLLLGYRKIG